MGIVERTRIGQTIRRRHTTQTGGRAVAAGELLVQRGATGAGIARVRAEQIVRVEATAGQHCVILQVILQGARSPTARTVIGDRNVRHKRAELVFAMNQRIAAGGAVVQERFAVLEAVRFGICVECEREER